MLKGHNKFIVAAVMKKGFNSCTVLIDGTFLKYSTCNKPNGR